MISMEHQLRAEVLALRAELAYLRFQLQVEQRECRILLEYILEQHKTETLDERVTLPELQETDANKQR